MTDAYYTAVERLPGQWGQWLAAMAVQQAVAITEVRLRSGCPVAVTLRGDSLFLAGAGQLVSARQGLPLLSHDELKNCFIHLCRYSVFSYENQLRRGYFTLTGGHRVGIAAQAAWDGDKLLQPKNITSLNIRIARCKPLYQQQQWAALLQKSMPRLLIAGPPGSGKTTVLRALAQLASDIGMRITVLDERCELFPVDSQGFCLAQPWNCDVISGMPKPMAISQALRALAPQLILCDELDGADVLGLLDGLNSGAGFVATIHADSWQELQHKSQFAALLNAQAVSEVIFLQGGRQPGMVREQRHVGA